MNLDQPGSEVRAKGGQAKEGEQSVEEYKMDKNFSSLCSRMGRKRPGSSPPPDHESTEQQRSHPPVRICSGNLTVGGRNTFLKTS